MNQSEIKFTANSFEASILTCVSFREPSEFLKTVRLKVGGSEHTKLVNEYGAAFEIPSGDIVEMIQAGLGNY